MKRVVELTTPVNSLASFSSPPDLLVIVSMPPEHVAMYVLSVRQGLMSMSWSEHVQGPGVPRFVIIEVLPEPSPLMSSTIIVLGSLHCPADPPSEMDRPIHVRFGVEEIETDVQGDHSGCFLSLVNIKTKVAFQYLLLTLKRIFFL